MAESTKVISPYLVKIELIIVTYCLYNHLCYGLILCPKTFSKHTKMNFIQKVLPFHVCAQSRYVYVLSAQRVYVQLFTPHWDYYAIIRFISAAFAPRFIVST